MLVFDKFKILNVDCYDNYKLLNLYYLFIFYEFVIYFDYKQLKNKELLHLKYIFHKFLAISRILRKEEKKKIFNSNFNFLGGFIFCIFIKEYNIFHKICELLNEKNIKFFFSFEKKFSNI